MGGKKCNEEICNVANYSLDLKSNKYLSANDMWKALAPVVHICTDSIAILSYLKSEIEENRHEYIFNCLYSLYRRLSRSVSPDSKWLFGDNIRRRIMTVTEDTENWYQNEDYTKN